ncbi:hypothetical protein [Shewanella sp. UCD-KL21]|uniref:hypothetical protein n=1 Tax=Shewanella sp. UCD-KL21 TaxID=1917164 RepID=UPI000970EE96|nr:hypothetical protein [Shewanella sp. UCD-KL21]
MVFKHSFLITTIVFLFYTTPLQAKNSLFGDDAEILVQACQEAVTIFQKRDEKRLLASISTSTSEALRAGYCIGVLQQYIKQNSSCRYSGYKQTNWYPMAEALASISFGSNAMQVGTSSSVLLEKVYCNG